MPTAPKAKQIDAHGTLNTALWSRDVNAAKIKSIFDGLKKQRRSQAAEFAQACQDAFDELRTLIPYCRHQPENLLAIWEQFENSGLDHLSEDQKQQLFEPLINMIEKHFPRHFKKLLASRHANHELLFCISQISRNTELFDKVATPFGGREPSLQQILMTLNSILPAWQFKAQPRHWRRQEMTTMLQYYADEIQMSPDGLWQGPETDLAKRVARIVLPEAINNARVDLLNNPKIWACLEHSINAAPINLHSHVAPFLEIYRHIKEFNPQFLGKFLKTTQAQAAIADFLSSYRAICDDILLHEPVFEIKKMKRRVDEVLFDALKAASPDAIGLFLKAGVLEHPTLRGSDFVLYAMKQDKHFLANLGLRAPGDNLASALNLNKRLKDKKSKLYHEINQALVHNAPLLAFHYKMGDQKQIPKRVQQYFKDPGNAIIGGKQAEDFLTYLEDQVPNANETTTHLWRALLNKCLSKAQDLYAHKKISTETYNIHKSRLLGLQLRVSGNLDELLKIPNIHALPEADQAKIAEKLRSFIIKMRGSKSIRLAELQIHYSLIGLDIYHRLAQQDPQRYAPELHQMIEAVKFLPNPKAWSFKTKIPGEVFEDTYSRCVDDLETERSRLMNAFIAEKVIGRIREFMSEFLLRPLSWRFFAKQDKATPAFFNKILEHAEGSADENILIKKILIYIALAKENTELDRGLSKTILNAFGTDKESAIHLLRQDILAQLKRTKPNKGWNDLEKEIIEPLRKAIKHPGGNSSRRRGMGLHL